MTRFDFFYNCSDRFNDAEYVFLDFEPGCPVSESGCFANPPHVYTSPGIWVMAVIC